MKKLLLLLPLLFLLSADTAPKCYKVTKVSSQVEAPEMKKDRVVFGIKQMTEEMLSEKPWFNGLDITTSPYQTSYKDENGRRYLTTIPILTFKINTKGIPKSISYNDVIKLENEVSDIVVPLFTSLFPYEDEDDNLDAVWDTKFDFHL